MSTKKTKKIESKPVRPFCPHCGQQLPDAPTPEQKRALQVVMDKLNDLSSDLQNRYDDIEIAIDLGERNINKLQKIIDGPAISDGEINNIIGNAEDTLDEMKETLNG